MPRIILLLSIAVATSFGQNLQVIITDLSISVDKAQSTNKIQWTAPVSQTPYFCVGTLGLNAMRFSCPDCNSTTIDQEIRSATRDLSNSFGFPIIRISNLKVGPQLNGKALVCEGTDSQNPDKIGPSASATLQIRYMNKPIIVNKDGEGPANIDGGNRFYLSRGSSLMLRCNASGNPNPTTWSWKVDGKELSKSQSFTVTQKNVGSSIICAANNGVSQYSVDSDGVKILPWDMPKVQANNFGSIQRTQSSSYIGTRVRVSSTLSLTVQVSGNPRPFVVWRQQNETGIFNATCQSVTNDVKKYPGTPYNPNNGRNPTQSSLKIPEDSYLIEYTCKLNVANYGFAGQYWASACNSVSASRNHCSPSLTSVPASKVKVDLIGPPMAASQAPTAGPRGADGPAKIYVYYCAYPAPQLPRGVYWTIDSQNVNIGNKDRYQPQTPRPNGTYCYTEELLISPFTKEDETKRYQLKLTNSEGNHNIDVDVRSLINGGEEKVGAGFNVGLAVGLALGCAVLLIIIIVAVMWWMGLACFARKKQPDEKYQSNVAPEHVRSEPPATQPYHPHSGNGYNPTPSEKNDGFYGSIRPGDREGMGFAEMDLTPNTRPVPTPDYRDYHHSPGGYPLKSATNSIV